VIGHEAAANGTLPSSAAKTMKEFVATVGGQKQCLAVRTLSAAINVPLQFPAPFMLASRFRTLATDRTNGPVAITV
jgi:hypothetical protein